LANLENYIKILIGKRKIYDIKKRSQRFRGKVYSKIAITTLTNYKINKKEYLKKKMDNFKKCY
jgi:hypothetical protein